MDGAHQEKGPRGKLKDTRPDDLLRRSFGACSPRYLSSLLEQIDDFILGCAFPEAEQAQTHRPHHRPSGRTA